MASDFGNKEFHRIMSAARCPVCGGTNIFAAMEKHRLLYGFAIGCLNLDCPNKNLVRCYALSAERAQNKAEKEWNRRAGEDG